MILRYRLNFIYTVPVQRNTKLWIHLNLLKYKEGAVPGGKKPFDLKYRICTVHVIIISNLIFFSYCS